MQIEIMLLLISHKKASAFSIAFAL